MLPNTPSFYSYINLSPKIFYIAYMNNTYLYSKIHIKKYSELLDFYKLIKKKYIKDLLFERLEVINLDFDRNITNNFLRKCINLIELQIPRNKIINARTINNLSKLKILNIKYNLNIILKDLCCNKNLEILTYNLLSVKYYDIDSFFEKSNLRNFNVGILIDYFEKKKLKKYINKFYPNVLLL